MCIRDRLNLIQEATEPHQNRGKSIVLEVDSWQGNIFDDIKLKEQLNVYRKPEIIHGIRNLVQNAVDFAKSTVWIRVDWQNDIVSFIITDDGLGFSPDMIGRLGDPFLKDKAYKNQLREQTQYEGMGLGLFIAKTLLERTGATLSFSNNTTKREAEQKQTLKDGAVVQVSWPKNLLEVTKDDARQPLSENPRN